jgi:hypothetical protein
VNHFYAAKKKQMPLPCGRAPARNKMHENVLSQVMLLRQTLRQSSNADAVQDLLQQTNVLMQMLLKHDVSIDLSSTGRDHTQLAKVAELMQMAGGIDDAELKARVSAQLHSVLSASLSSCLCSAAAKPNRSDTMSTLDKLQHVRTSLLSSFDA